MPVLALLAAWGAGLNTLLLLKLLLFLRSGELERFETMMLGMPLPDGLSSKLETVGTWISAMRGLLKSLLLRNLVIYTLVVPSWLCVFLCSKSKEGLLSSYCSWILTKEGSWVPVFWTRMLLATLWDCLRRTTAAAAARLGWLEAPPSWYNSSDVVDVTPALLLTTAFCCYFLCLSNLWCCSYPIIVLLVLLCLFR